MVALMSSSTTTVCTRHHGTQVHARYWSYLPQFHLSLEVFATVLSQSPFIIYMLNQINVGYQSPVNINDE